MENARECAVDRKSGVFLIEGMSGRTPRLDKELIRLGLLPEFSKELPKTDKEDRAIRMASVALNSLLNELGLEPLRIDPDAIHVIGEIEFFARWGADRRAFAQFGHVYLCRSILLLYFLQDLAHELVHVAALKAVFAPSRGRDGAIVYLRSGFTPLDGRPYTERWRFIGFNEGVTERIAMELRRRMAPAAREMLSEELTYVFVNECMYPPYVRLVDGIVRAVAGNGSENEARRALFADYFTRSFGFLRTMSRALPGSVPALAMMETGREAHAVARRLGLVETAADIERCLSRRRKR